MCGLVCSLLSKDDRKKKNSNYFTGGFYVQSTIDLFSMLKVLATNHHIPKRTTGQLHPTGEMEVLAAGGH